MDRTKTRNMKMQIYVYNSLYPLLSHYNIFFFFFTIFHEG